MDSEVSVSDDKNLTKSKAFKCKDCGTSTKDIRTHKRFCRAIVDIYTATKCPVCEQNIESTYYPDHEKTCKKFGK